MSDLERALVDLGKRIDAPDPARAHQAALSRLSRIPPARTPPSRLRWIVGGVAVLVGALGAALGLSPAIADRLGLRAVDVRYADGPPPTVSTAVGVAGLGEPLALPQAQGRVAFDILVPSQLGRPDAVYQHGPAVSLVYGASDDLPPTPSGFGALVTQLPGRTETAIVQKFVHSGTTVRELRIDGGRALWITGAPHDVLLPGLEPAEARAGGSVLLWERSDLTVRLESSLDLEASIRVLRSLR